MRDYVSAHDRHQVHVSAETTPLDENDPKRWRSGEDAWIEREVGPQTPHTRPPTVNMVDGSALDPMEIQTWI